MNDIFQNASFVEWETKQAVQKSIQNLYPLANETKVFDIIRDCQNL